MLDFWADITSAIETYCMAKITSQIYIICALDAVTLWTFSGNLEIISFPSLNDS